MIAAGTRLTMSVKGETTNTIWNPLGFQTDDLRRGVMDALASTFTVNSLSVTARTSVYTGYLGWPYTCTIVVTTKTGYAKAADPASIVADAFYQVGGALPTVNISGYPETGSYDPSTPGTNEPDAYGIADLIKSLGVFGVIAIAVAVFVIRKT